MCAFLSVTDPRMSFDSASMFAAKLMTRVIDIERFKSHARMSAVTTTLPYLHTLLMYATIKVYLFYSALQINN